MKFRLVESESPELEKFSKEDKVVREYMNKLNRINEDPAFLNIMDYEQDNKMIMNSLKKQAREEGLEEGRKKGMKEGIKEGREEGREDIKKEFIKKMTASGMTINEISSILDLEKEKIQKYVIE